MRNWVIVVLVVAGAFPAVVFPVYYTLTGRWWTSSVGRHLFAFSLVAGLTFLNSTILVFVRDYPGRSYVRYALTFGAVFVVWQRVWVYWNSRRKVHKIEREEEEA